MMTFGFFLKVILAPYDRLVSDASEERCITLPEPIGRVCYRGSPRGTSFSDASIILFSGSGYASRATAEHAGRKLRDTLLLASLDAGISLDIGTDKVLGGPGQVVIDAAAKDAVLLLPDVHGLLVFEETGIPVQMTGTAAAYVGTPLSGFENAMKIRSQHSDHVDEKHALATQLHGLSRFEASLRSRLLTLVTALDILSEQHLRGGIAQQVAAELFEVIKARTREARQSHADSELPQLNSLMSIVGSLKYQSISASIKDLAAEIDSAILHTKMSAREVIELAYKARNELIHGGQTTVDLAMLLVPLERLTAELCGGLLLSVKECAGILHCSEGSVRRHLANGTIVGTKSNNRWHIRSVDLKLFMMRSV
jgi:hypothetical protein